MALDGQITARIAPHATIRRLAYAAGEAFAERWSRKTLDCWGDVGVVDAERLAEVTGDAYQALCVRHGRGLLNDATTDRVVRAALPWLRQGYIDALGIECE